jgi:acetyl-CoA synthetase
MPWEPIHKFSQNWDLPPNLLDYDQTYAVFSWEAVRGELDGLPGERGLNMAHEAVDRHANGARRDHLALRWLGKDGTVRDFTYGDLQEHSNRFANVLASLGVGKGDRVFTLAGRLPALSYG